MVGGSGQAGERVAAKRVGEDGRIQILNATPPTLKGGAIWDDTGSSLPPSKGEPMGAQITLRERYAISLLKQTRTLDPRDRAGAVALPFEHLARARAQPHEP
jgi:hypothetical protein